MRQIKKRTKREGRTKNGDVYHEYRKWHKKGLDAGYEIGFDEGFDEGEEYNNEQHITLYKVFVLTIIIMFAIIVFYTI